MQLKLSKPLSKTLKGKFSQYHFEVGVLEDKPHKQAKVGQRGLKGQDVLGNYAGGPIRKKSAKNSGLSIAQVGKENRQRLGINYLTAPFKKKNSDIIKFSKLFFKMVFGKPTHNQAKNLLQAIVRNPILKGDYGSNSALTEKIKGFNRGMIDTAQLFKAIQARVIFKNVRK